MHTHRHACTRNPRTSKMPHKDGDSNRGVGSRSATSKPAVFWGKIGSAASLAIFPFQLSFNQPMQMHCLRIYHLFFALTFVSQLVIAVKCVIQQLCKQMVGWINWTVLGRWRRRDGVKAKNRTRDRDYMWENDLSLCCSLDLSPDFIYLYIYLLF